MAGKPNDRLKTPETDARPEIYAMIDGKRFPRPGLETVFADLQSPAAKSTQKEPQCREEGSRMIAGAYCSCNKVCTCVPVCSCVGHRGCSCVGHTSCRCVGYTQCSCVGHVSCSCEGHTVVTGCRCAPVH